MNPFPYAVETNHDPFGDAEDFTSVYVDNFSLEKIQPLLGTYLGNLPSRNRSESWKDVGAGLVGGRIDSVLVGGQAPKALVELVFHGSFDFESQKRYDFYSMIDVLRIKLRESLREEQGAVYGVRLNAAVNQYPVSNYRITASFNADPEEVHGLLETALSEIRKLKEFGASEADLSKVKEIQRQTRIKSLKENNFWLGQLTARYREDIPLEGMRLETYENYIDGLNSEAVKKAAIRYFDPDNFIKIVLIPEPRTDGG